ncbi:MAG TPA: AAA family ATPase, partial [Acidimicrobiales bacterium]
MAASIPLEDLDMTLALARADDWRTYGVVTEESTATVQRAAGEPPSGMVLGGLVARGRELAALDRALVMARRGQSDVVVLRGDPGTGKSSLVQAAMGRARDFRNVALRGTLYVEGSVPEGGWPQPIIDLLHEFSPLEPTAEPDSPVVQAMVGALTALAGHSLAPLLLSVDDCHLLPGWFTVALAHAIGALGSTPIVLVLSASTLAGTTMATDEELGVTSYRLKSLTVKQAKLLLDLRSDRMPVPRVLLELVQRTGGNPEALLDVCNRLDAEELSGHRALPDPLPLGSHLVAKFARRFEELPENTQQALSVGSAGRIPFDTLKRTLSDLGISEDDLKPAQRAGQLEASRDRIEFRHPIERSAIYWLSSEEARSKAHTAVAKVLLEQNRVELASYHATRCEKGKSNALARLHFEAARIAIDRGDPEEAARHHEAASEFAESSEATAHHLVLAAALLMSLGRLDRALTYLDRATQLDPSDHLRGQAAYLEARARWSNDVDPELADEMIAAADLCEGDATDW